LQTGTEGEMGELLLLFVHDQEWREATRCAVTGRFLTSISMSL